MGPWPLCNLYSVCSKAPDEPPSMCCAAYGGLLSPEVRSFDRKMVRTPARFCCGCQTKPSESTAPPDGVRSHRCQPSLRQNYRTEYPGHDSFPGPGHSPLKTYQKCFVRLPAAAGHLREYICHGACR